MQPITMMAGMLARQLQRAQTDPQTLVKLATDMQLACKSAIAARTDVLTWFQPSEQNLGSIDAEVAQSTNMLTAEFAIQGCSIDNQVQDRPQAVLKSNLRTVLIAALFAILDTAHDPVVVQLRVLPSSTNDGTTIALSWTTLPASDLRSTPDTRHTIGWEDVQAIADQTGVGMRRADDRCEIDFAAAS